MVAATETERKPKEKKVRTHGPDGKLRWVLPSELEATHAATEAAPAPQPAADEPVTLTRADYARLMALLEGKTAKPDLPVAGVDKEGYAIVAPPQSRDERAKAEEAAWRTPDGQTYRHWYSPEFPDITLRPHHNHVIQFRSGAYTPINAKEDAYLRDWVWRQRGKNDPELWHGDTPSFDSPDMPDLECEFCHRFSCRNQHVMAAHKAKKHKREDLAEHPWTGFSPNLIRAGRVAPRA